MYDGINDDNIIVKLLSDNPSCIGCEDDGLSPEPCALCGKEDISLKPSRSVIKSNHKRDDYGFVVRAD